MKITQDTKGVIKKINTMLKRGKMAGRGREKYTIFNTFSVNCFGHAVFNFSNQEIRNLRRKHEDELRTFLCGLWEPDDNKESFKDITEQLEQKIRDTGLILEECQEGDKVKEGQWKVAYYYYDDGGIDKDFHFMRQEKDGRWSSKLGTFMEIEYYDRLPLMFNYGYCLAKVYKVTNPYIYKEASDEEKDM